jgi:hypothetical protein
MSTRSRSELLVVAALLLVASDARSDPPPAPVAPSTEDPLAPYRERFKQGMDRYKDGSLADAIGYWEPIYRELGEKKGYRLAYNIGVAYAELGDATRAAERLQSFLAQVGERRARGETVEDIVAKEEDDAKARLERLRATRGRIRIDPGERPCAVQVDASEARLAGYVAWVSPGRHTVVFSPATEEAASQAVDVAAGELVTLSPPHSPAPVPSVLPAGADATPTGTQSPPSTKRVTTHPVSPVYVAIGGGLAVAAGVVAVALDTHAWTLRNSDAAALGRGSTISASDRQAFYDARTQAYTAMGVGIGFAAITAGLSAWYFLGAKEREVVATPAGLGWRF